MGSFVAKQEPGQTQHPRVKKIVTLTTSLQYYSIVCCCLAEKEIPIPVKQEPVESKEPIIDTDKAKTRYKKIIPQVPPSPVSRKVFFMLYHIS